MVPIRTSTPNSHSPNNHIERVKRPAGGPTVGRKPQGEGPGTYPGRSSSSNWSEGWPPRSCPKEGGARERARPGEQEQQEDGPSTQTRNAISGIPIEATSQGRSASQGHA